MKLLAGVQRPQRRADGTGPRRDGTGPGGGNPRPQSPPPRRRADGTGPRKDGTGPGCNPNAEIAPPRRRADGTGPYKDGTGPGCNPLLSDSVTFRTAASRPKYQSLNIRSYDPLPYVHSKVSYYVYWRYAERWFELLRDSDLEINDELVYLYMTHNNIDTSEALSASDLIAFRKERNSLIASKLTTDIITRISRFMEMFLITSHPDSPDCDDIKRALNDQLMARNEWTLPREIIDLVEDACQDDDPETLTSLRWALRDDVFSGAKNRSDVSVSPSALLTWQAQLHHIAISRDTDLYNVDKLGISRKMLDAGVCSLLLAAPEYLYSDDAMLPNQPVCWEWRIGHSCTQYSNLSPATIACMRPNSRYRFHKPVPTELVHKNAAVQLGFIQANLDGQEIGN